MEENNESVAQESNEVKTYTEQEVEQIKAELKEENEKKFDSKFNKKLGREMAKIQREYAKQNELVDLIKNQTGKNNLDDLLKLTYEQYGVEKPVESQYNDNEAKILGKYDAKEILDSGDYEDIEEEANRLSDITNRTPREQATFMELANYLTSKKTEQKRKKEMAESGIDDETLKDAEFQDYLSKFKEDTPISFIYESYMKTKPKKEKPFTTGSLKGTNVEDKNMVKDFYTYEESLAFTRKDFDKNPALWKAIQDSAEKWGKR